MELKFLKIEISYKVKNRKLSTVQNKSKAFSCENVRIEYGLFSINQKLSEKKEEVQLQILLI